MTEPLDDSRLRQYRRVARGAQATYVGRNWPSMRDMQRDGIGYGLVEKPAHEARIRRYLDTFQPEMLVAMLDAWLAERRAAHINEGDAMTDARRSMDRLRALLLAALAEETP